MFNLFKQETMAVKKKTGIFRRPSVDCVEIAWITIQNFQQKELSSGLENTSQENDMAPIYLFNNLLRAFFGLEGSWGQPQGPNFPSP